MKASSLAREVGFGADAGLACVGPSGKFRKDLFTWPLRLSAREGECLKEGEGQESLGVARRRDPEPTSLTGEGMKPLKRGRAWQQCLQRW
jgi:hypothetical protein